jgi:hypothetical protein
MATCNTTANSLVPKVCVCVQENNKEYQILYEAENSNRFATHYPDEATNADYEMDGTQSR